MIRIAAFGAAFFLSFDDLVVTVLLGPGYRAEAIARAHIREALQTRLHTANDAYRAAVQEARTYWPLTQTRCLDSSTRCSSA